ncbi:hypothetical protein B0G80_1703 [Paraburkholderia sp. BL6669N2]|uniref:hypothetical protein n=1 Tax=Paraburkholderia sp. BL6669N2 TaxID=1938807 RepID=UPI000E384D38|nr:hypothetical protein [Paraburkholderia sp. BL6669N2]REG58978.1 hypothetical protein B0G80_1703 [Paraburkholderia sp. BL6669N2]
MDSLPDQARQARQAWLCEMQNGQTRSQSDFEKSAVWRGVFVAAFIVIVINIPVSPPTAQSHALARATV